MTKNDIHLPEAFMRKFPELTEKKAKKLHNKYLNVVRMYLFRKLPYMENGIINFPLKEAFDNSGEFQYKNERYYVWKEFYATQPFFYIHKVGNNLHHMLSEVRIKDQKYIDLLIDTADKDELVKTFYSKYENNQSININIDYDSLISYISRTEHQLQSIDTSTTYYNKLLANLRTAKFFKIISEYYCDIYGDYVIPHIISDKKDYGRTYYKGINLQNCSKEVREAAIGDHVSYDLNAAAYAIKLVLAKNIYDEFKMDFNGMFTYTKEYLDHKSEIRNQLANVIHQHMPNYPDPKKLVKEAMNAIGFGAKVHEGSWEVNGYRQYNALHFIIYNKDARQAFAKHDFVVNFLKEQQLLSNIIFEYYSRNNEFINNIKHIKDIYDKNDKLIKTKVLAYLYQQMETLIMNMITKNIKPLLRIHDSFIVTKALNSETLKDVKYELSQISPYLSLSTEMHNGWIHQDVLQMELDHKRFIEQEELLANNGRKFSKTSKHITKQYNKTDHTCYDGYDDGSRYDQYDPNSDDSVSSMTYQERMEHYRIVGYNSNKLPNHISKLLGDNK